MNERRAKHRRLVVSGIVAVMLVGLSGCGSTPIAFDENGKYILKFADFFPAGHPLSEEGGKYFMQRATTLSGGKLDFKYFPSEQLGAAEDILQLVRSGVVEIGLTVPGYTPAELPLAGVADLPGLTSGSCVASKAVAELLKPDGVLYREDFAPNGVRPLAVGTIRGYEVMTTEKPVAEPEDAAGLLLRSTGGTLDRALGNLGAAPVAMSVTDTYEAMSRGTVDGLVLSPMSADQYRMSEVTQYSTSGAELGGNTNVFSISERIWYQLPGDLRDALTQAGEETTENLCQAIDDNQAIAKAKMESDGVTFTPLEGPVLKQWQQAAVPVQDKWVSDMTEIGKPGAEAVEALQSELKDLEP